MNAKIIVVLAIFALFAVASQAQFVYSPYAYAYPGYYPSYYGGWVWGSNKGAPSGPAGPNGRSGPSLTNNAPRA